MASNTTQALWIVIIALSVSCAVLLSVVIKSTYFKSTENNATTDAYEGDRYSPPSYTPEGGAQDGSSKGGEERTEPWHDFRLSKFVFPEHYDLLLKPNISGEVFQGQVNITVNITRDTNTIIVHKYHTLHVDQSRMYDFEDRSEVQISKSFEYQPNEFLVIQTSEVLQSGRRYIVSMSFGASLVNGLVGFYKSIYTNKKLNTTSAIVSSKFQPTFARRAFPCFDEPNWKSTYTVTLVHSPDVTALSNMPIETSELNEEGDKVTKFQKSVPMVTYLVCFVIGDYKYLETFTNKGTRFRVYATPDQIDNAKYSLDFGSHVLSYFEQYFGIPYPLPKQDMVAIPDFVSGAMEHWGLITYRETNLLYNEKSSSAANKQRVAAVVSHELAHMWFGNLVTMWWWDDLWLNEGFASYLEYKGVIDYEKKWDMSAQFLTADLQSVMELDSKKSSHPIIQAVHHPDQITEIFDRISYSKGASVLRMLEAFMGPDDFRRGVQSFLMEREYGNANTEDLWSKLSLKSSAGYDISTIMRSWTTQKGFPIVSVTRDSSGFFASQQVYIEDRQVDSNNLEKDESTSQVWQIPLTYVTSQFSNEEQLVWLNSTSPVKFELPLHSSTDWIKFNVKQAGYYLVNYEPSDWHRLQHLLLTNHETLSVEDRSSLLHDSFKLASAGYIGYDVAFNMTRYLVKETHFVPWMSIYSFFADILNYLSTSKGYFDLRKYVIHLTSPLMEKLGWQDSGNHLDKLLRSVILKLSCRCGHQPCLDEAGKLFNKWMAGKTIHPNLRTRIYEFGMKQHGFPAWDYMWNRYKNETSAQEKTKLLFGLSKTRITWLLNRYLRLAEDEENIKRQDYFTVLRYIAGNPTGRPIVWMYLRQKWPYLVRRFTLNDRYLGRAVKSIVEGFKSEFRLREVNDFFKKYPEAGAGQRGRKQALESVEGKIRWLRNNEAVVNNWLKDVVENL